MTIKTLSVALCLTLVPVMSFAEGCQYGKHQQAQSCADGMQFDTNTGTCVQVNA